MDKLKMESMDVIGNNIKMLENIFPSCITEIMDENGELKKVVNFDKLKLLLGDKAAEVYLDNRECYEFTWPGKKEAILNANTPIRKTLRPCVEDSVNWNTTENLYIEGDNLEVLKLLQESYLSKVKMIYIDPPYNTGNDFIYRDDFRMSPGKYMNEVGQVDVDGIRMIKNTDINGRFHSDWCSMIYPRLMLARNLLSEDGIIFISIDDNEQENLKKICDEIFGGQNFISNLIWQRAYSPKNDAKYISTSHDYILMYAKNIQEFKIGRLERTEAANARYANPDNDPRGVWKPSDLSAKRYTPADIYKITTPSGRIVEPPAGRSWSLSKKAFFERLQDNRIWFGKDGNSVPQLKRFLSELKNEGMSPQSILFYDDVGHSQEGAKEVTKMFECGAFDGPKPLRLILRLITLANLKSDSIVLDFFSGSATTAHALMKFNATKKVSCKFILVQIPDCVEKETDAYSAGYKNICDIGKERVRRGAIAIKKENPDSIFDAGFRVLKADDTNMMDVYYGPSEYRQDLLSELESNIKPDRTDLDLLFGCLIDWGLQLSLPYSSESVEGCTIHDYNQGELVACFDEQIPETVIKHIAGKHPLRAVFRDSSFKDSPSKINIKEMFKLLSPDTCIKVI